MWNLLSDAVAVVAMFTLGWIVIDIPDLVKALVDRLTNKNLKD
ncbi:hypothetical protein GCM10012275_50470 [Longimycelium tulufanense]|uniref:Uncharacterized protein n=1 Tax=Longimycelium tulufanense TaxID=907463 RepID=A0A8J3CIG3_9PSEU|nr:hypothetical protein GCM10012275_50470 [Longimycelium tulufanense]